ncbi:4a-hydroxytetrahydrobiopterin dehydratase [Nodosilinea nodulosa]|uniref:4a-hydroxytetrahydrobiopterin dehydratase n=1 Tax=Nodosilinea nodulosa TaxID=416001 RepID=UPI0021F8C3B9
MAHNSWIGRICKPCRLCLAGALGLGATLSGGATLAASEAVPPGWSIVGDSLVTECHFADFAATIAFVDRLVEPADRLGHHPDLGIAYNRLVISLTTHDAGGVTSLDFALAQEITALQSGQCEPPSPPSSP